MQIYRAGGARFFYWRRRVFQSVFAVGTRSEDHFLRGARILIIAGVIASPWFVKNIVWVGNPVYPFAQSVFPTPHWTEFNTAFFSYHAGLKGSLTAVKQSPLGIQLLDFVTMPLRITFFPGDFRLVKRYGSWPLGDLTAGNGWRLWCPPAEDFGTWPIGALWLILVPFVFLRRVWNDRFLFHVVSVFFLYLVWAYTYRDTRFLLPALAIASPVIAMVAMERIRERSWSYAPLLGVILYGICSTACLLLIPRTYMPWDVISGKFNDESYIENYRIRTTSEPASNALVSNEERYLAIISDFTSVDYQAFQYLRENVPLNERVLLHGIDQPFYCSHSFIGADWFNTDPLLAWSWESTSTEELLERIRNEKIRYIVYNYGKIEQYNNPERFYSLFRLPPEEGFAFLKELKSKEYARILYRYTYVEWRNQFEQRIKEAEAKAVNVSILNQLLEGGILEEAFRYEEENPRAKKGERPLKGIVVLKVPYLEEKMKVE